MPGQQKLKTIAQQEAGLEPAMVQAHFLKAAITRVRLGTDRMNVVLSAGREAIPLMQERYSHQRLYMQVGICSIAESA